VEREPQEKILAAGGELRGDVLKVPHHGSRDAAWPAFVAAVNPRVAVFTTKTGSAQFPAAQTLALYRAADATALELGRHGAVIIETDGRRLRVRTMY
jgi:competence protein ComEC